MKFKSVRVRLETYNNLLIIQKILRQRNVDERLCQIMDTSIRLLKYIVERRNLELDLNQIMKQDPTLSLKLIVYFGRSE